MPAGKDKELDAVIADLIDSDTGTGANPEEEESFKGIGASKPVNGRPTVSLTARAARQVRKIKKEESLDEKLDLRVAVEGGGCSGLSYKLGFDYKTDEDRIFESEGVSIVINPRHLMYIEGISIDYPDGLDARGFTFDNPQAEETCGCGTSFAT